MYIIINSSSKVMSLPKSILSRYAARHNQQASFKVVAAGFACASSR